MITMVLKKIKKWIDKFRNDSRKPPEEKKEPSKKVWNKVFLVGVDAARKFTRDNLIVRAFALAFYSLLSIVPFMALAFGIAKGFGLQEVLQNQLKTQLALPGNVETRILDFAQTTLEKAQGGWVAGLGLLFLFISITLLFSQMEDAFNTIWGIKKGRTLSVKIRDYFSTIFIGTILLLVSLSLTVTINNIPSLFGYLSSLVSWLIGLVPYVLTWLLFSFLIIFMPNRRISWKAGLFAGVVTGTLYQLSLSFYIKLQVTVSVYNAIYGSFAALPLFLLWLQVSWICLLYGAEFSYVFENFSFRGYNPDSRRISIKTRKVLLLHIVHYISKCFRREKTLPPTADLIGRELGLSPRLIINLLEDLVEGGLLVKTELIKNKTPSYQPGVPLNELTVYRILKLVDEKGISELPAIDKNTMDKIHRILDKSDRQLAKAGKLRIDELD